MKRVDELFNYIQHNDEENALKIPQEKDMKKLVKKSCENTAQQNQDTTSNSEEINNNNNNEMPFITVYNKKKKKPPNSRGRTAHRNTNFIEYLSNENINTEDLNTLGAVDTQNKAYYFEESEESKQCAKEFLETFWSNPKFLTYTFEEHQKKHAKELKLDPKVKTSVPCCISFTNAIINNKKYCFISTSFPKAFVFNMLKKHAKELNESDKKDVEYIVINGDLENLNNSFKKLLGNEYANKKCAEKYYIKCFIKLFLEYGENMQITGSSNCAFYPYEQNKSYGRNSLNLETRIVCPPPTAHNSNSIEIANNKLLSFIPCCTECQNNKEATFTMLKTAQVCGEQNLKEKEESRKVELSPLRNSIGTTSSLLKTNSMFKQKTKHSSATSSDVYKSVNYSA